MGIAVNDICFITGTRDNIDILCVIERETKTMWIVEYNINGDPRMKRFNKQTMREAGSQGYFTPRLVKATQTDINRIRKEREGRLIRQAIRRTDFTKYNTDELRVIRNALDEAQDMYEARLKR